MQNAAKSLAWSFEQPYQGPALDNFISVLYKHMDEYDSSKFYGRNIPIIQSSGTGKSKLIRDLSKKAQCYIYPCISVYLSFQVDPSRQRLLSSIKRAWSGMAAS
jgi:hypothetical protein